jgi:uncharacterized membrane protein YhiD involved in acid resistance
VFVLIYNRNGTTLRSIFQITLSTILGYIPSTLKLICRVCLGGERRLHNSRLAKMGPYTLICVASCLFTIVSRNIATFADGLLHEVLNLIH